jgi:hypothetical protein
MSCAACRSFGLNPEKEHQPCAWCTVDGCPFDHRCPHGVECSGLCVVSALARGEVLVAQLRCGECDAAWRARGCPAP